MDGTTIFGTVKWYDPIKGYGFIAREDGGDDLFVHRSAVDAGGLNEGDRVTCDVVRGLKGSNAERVRVIERSGLPPRGGERGYRADDRGGNGYPRPSLESLPLLTGTIKRYDAEKGYGFISPDDGSADVFVHRTAAGVDAIGPGDRIEFRLGRGPKGPRAEQVRIIEPGQRTDAWSARGNY